MPFYRDILGFGVSDYYYIPFTAYFFHVNPRHHSFALIETGEKKVHHMMMELFSFDDIGQGYDIAQRDRGPRLRHARPPRGRLPDLVLHLEPVRLHVRVRLGRTIDRSGHLGAVRAQGRAKPVGP